MGTNTVSRGGRELLRRYLSFLAALFVIAFGTSLSIRANLGSSPISAPPYVLSVVPGSPLTMGQFTICMHVLFIIAQILMLRRDFQKIQLLQIVVSFIFGIYTDLTMWLTSFLQIPSDTPLGYGLRLVELLCGGAILAYGISAEVHCDVLMLAGEGFPLAISKVVRRDFGRVKICSDTGLVCIGIAFMFYFFHHWDWKLIGPGTLISMFYVGAMVRVFSPHFGWLEHFFATVRPQTAAASGEPAEPLPLVITVSREYGSGGHLMAELLSRQLGIEYYDKDIIHETAAELGYTPDYVAEKEQNISTRKLWELIFTDNAIPPSMNPSHDDAIFVSESRTIRSLASRQSCIIIGRLANWILRDRPHTFRVFVTSNEADAVSRVMATDHLSRDAAKERVESVNKGRSNHYWTYTQHSWTDVREYDLVVNTSHLTIDGAAHLIAEAVRLQAGR